MLGGVQISADRENLGTLRFREKASVEYTESLDWACHRI